MKAAAGRAATTESRYDLAWDPTLVWIAVAARDAVSSSDPKVLRWATLLVLRVASGWRSELVNITRRLGVKFEDDGVLLRYCDGKTTKSRWAKWTRFSKCKEKEVCLVVLLKRYLDITEATPKKLVEVPDPEGTGLVEDEPLFLTFTTDDKGLYTTLKQKTVSSLSKAGLTLLMDSDGPLARLEGKKARYTGHSYRTTTVSYLMEMGCEPEMVRNRVHASSEGVSNKHYKIPVRFVVKPEDIYVDTASIDDAIRAGYYTWKHARSINIDALTSEGWQELSMGGDYAKMSPEQRANALRVRVHAAHIKQCVGKR